MEKNKASEKLLEILILFLDKNCLNNVMIFNKIKINNNK